MIIDTEYYQMFIIVKWNHFWQAAFENESPIFFKSQLLTPVGTNIVVSALQSII